MQKLDEEDIYEMKQIRDCKRFVRKTVGRTWIIKSLGEEPYNLEVLIKKYQMQCWIYYKALEKYKQGIEKTCQNAPHSNGV